MAASCGPTERSWPRLLVSVVCTCVCVCVCACVLCCVRTRARALVTYLSVGCTVLIIIIIIYFTGTRRRQLYWLALCIVAEYAVGNRATVVTRRLGDRSSSSRVIQCTLHGPTITHSLALSHAVSLSLTPLRRRSPFARPPPVQYARSRALLCSQFPRPSPPSRLVAVHGRVVVVNGPTTAPPVRARSQYFPTPPRAAVAVLLLYGTRSVCVCARAEHRRAVG